MFSFINKETEVQNHVANKWQKSGLNSIQMEFVRDRGRGLTKLLQKFSRKKTTGEISKKFWKKTNSGEQV